MDMVADEKTRDYWARRVKEVPLTMQQERHMELAQKLHDLIPLSKEELAEAIALRDALQRAAEQEIVNNFSKSVRRLFPPKRGKMVTKSYRAKENRGSLISELRKVLPELVGPKMAAEFLRDPRRKSPATI